MSKPKASYEARPFPLSRRIIVDSARAGQRKRMVRAMVEVDVTEARRILHTHKEKTGESLSFTGFLLTCLGNAVEQDKMIHACRDLWGRIILFDEVDCTVIIETELQGKKFPLAHVLRAINQRSFRSIHEEIRSVQTNPPSSPSLQHTGLMSALLLLPAFIRDIFYWFFARSPHTLKQQTGTIMVSSVGMFGMGGGWGMSPGSLYTTDLLVGGIAEKPVVVGGQVAVREMLSLTISMDHDFIDGAPAARFVSGLKGRIESAYGLEEVR